MNGQGDEVETWKRGHMDVSKLPSVVTRTGHCGRPGTSRTNVVDDSSDVCRRSATCVADLAP